MEVKKLQDEDSNRSNPSLARIAEALTVTGRTLAGGVGLGSLAVLAAPEVALPTAVTVTIGAVAGLFAGYWAKLLDK